MSAGPAREGARRSLLHRIIGPPSTRAGRWSAWLVGAVIGVLAAVGGLVFVGAADLGWGALLVLVLSSASGVLLGIVAGGVAVAGGVVCGGFAAGACIKVSSNRRADMERCYYGCPMTGCLSA